MSYRLGLDLGTASIGAVAVSLQDNKPSAIVWHTVRIFPEPVQRNASGGLVLKKADRRQARQLRKQIDRRARRLRGIAQLASLLKLDKTQLLPNTRQNLIALRAQAARQRIELTDFYRVLLQLAKRRGYPGSFSQKKKGKVKDKSDKLQLAMQELATTKKLPSVTLGEYLYECRMMMGLPTKLGAEHPENHEPLCALRQMVKEEFEQIWENQAKYHPLLKTQSIKDKFNSAIFYQRPLKSPAAAVGKCGLEKNLPRAPRAHMAAQNFRIEKTLRDLRWGSKNGELLSEEQLNVLRKLLETPSNSDGKVSFENINQALKEAGLQDEKQRKLNLSQHRRYLIGNKTIAVWKKIGLLESWDALSENSQTTIINFLADLGSPEILEDDKWHLKIRGAKSLVCRQFAQEVIEFIDKLRSNEAYDRFSKMDFEAGRSSYSIKALNKLNEWLKNPWWPADTDDTNIELYGKVDEDTAIRVCYPDYFKKPASLLDRLDKPSRTGSVVVDIALRELRNVINECINKLGESPKEIIIEMVREVNMGIDARNEHEKRRAQNELDNQRIAKEITERDEKATDTNIKKYRLWETQNNKCPYCGGVIKVSDVFDGRVTNFEHIQPRSWTQVGQKQSEIVLAHTTCNTKKKNQTPWQAFGNDPDLWEAVKNAAKNFEEQATKANIKKDFAKKQMFKRKSQLLLMEDWIEEEETIDDFVDRQRQQTSWISKAVSKWLRTIAKSVSVSRGQFTATLRRKWSLETVIPEARLQEGLEILDTQGKKISQETFKQHKLQWEGHSANRLEATDQKLNKRIDRRHHAIDALIIALTDRSLYKNLTENRRDEYKKPKESGTRIKGDLSIEPPLPNIRDQASKMIQDCHVHYKSDHNVNGKFFQDHAYGTLDKEDGEQSQLTIHKSLKDLIDSKSLDKTNKNIESIVSPTVKAIVEKAFKEGMESGKNYKEALCEPIFYPAYKTKIWKVLCFAKRYTKEANCIVHTSRNGTHKKYLLNNGYAYLELRIKNGKPTTKLVAYQEAKNIGFVKTQEKDVVRFFKGDVVLNKVDNLKYVIGKYSAQSDGTLFLFPIAEARTVSELEKAKVRKTVSGKNLLNLQLV